jgi:hypothetical protein
VQDSGRVADGQRQSQFARKCEIDAPLADRPRLHGSAEIPPERVHAFLHDQLGALAPAVTSTVSSGRNHDTSMSRGVDEVGGRAGGGGDLG